MRKQKVKICKNCKHYVKKKDFYVCCFIDDNYTQHYSGFFMPPPDFGCNKFLEKDKKW